MITVIIVSYERFNAGRCALFVLAVSPLRREVDRLSTLWPFWGGHAFATLVNSYSWLKCRDCTDR
jgi:hypothetical protein